MECEPCRRKSMVSLEPLPVSLIAEVVWAKVSTA